MIKIWTPKLYLLSLLSLLGIFVLMFLTMSFEEIEGVFINSDTLYQPSLYWDAIENGNDMARWRLNPAPNFFPDMGLYSILMLISGSNILFSSFAFSIIQIAIINALLFYLFKKLKQGHHAQIMILANLLFGLFALTDILSDNFRFAFNIISNSYHMGSFVNTLIAINLTLSILENRKTWKWILLGFICIIGYPSDKIFLISFVIPTTLVLIQKLIFENDQKPFIILLAHVLVYTAIGWSILEILLSNGNLEIEDPHSFMNFENIGNSFNELLNQLSDYWYDMSFVTLILVFAFISLVLQIFLGIIELYQSKPTWFGLFALINASIIIAPVLAGNYTGLDTLRYNFHGYLFAVCLLPLALYEIFFSDKLVTKIAIPTSVASLVLFVWLYISQPIDANVYFNYYPSIAQSTDKFVALTGQKNGTAQYWQAKVIMMFSKEKAFVVPTFESLLPYDHATSKNYFSTHPVDHSRPAFTFSIIDMPERKQAIIDRFGEENTNTYLIDGIEFMIHPPYVYEHNTYVIFAQ